MKLESGHGSNGSNGGANGNGNGTNGNGSAVGRGSTRGRRDRGVELLRTRPDSLTSKKGEGGIALPNLLSNYFKLHGKPDWGLHQYRVDFAPEEDQTFIRKMLVRDVKEQLPKYMFDGTVMFTCEKLPTQPLGKGGKLTFTTIRKGDQAAIQITIAEVGEVQPTDYHYTQFFNMILRSCLQKLNLSLVGRNYYDEKAKTILKEYCLELWPGYVTSIRQHENEVLLMCEVSTKVMRTDTVLDQLQACYRKDRNNFQNLAAKTLMGTIVITKYNNKTYRVDDISWEKNISDKFPWRDGTEISLIEYYEKKYQIKVTDKQQPLLVSRPTEREQRQGGSTGDCWLIPELCHMTGMSDEQRANFQLMKAMATHTRPTPDSRVDRLKSFAKRMNNTPEIKEILDSWNLRFTQELIKFNARTLNPETILGGKNQKATYQKENADWGSAFRKWEMVDPKSINKWAVIYPPRDADSTNEFISCLKKVGPPLGLAIGNPKKIPIQDNRPGTYIQQLDHVYAMKPEIVMIVIPNNKGEHYHAIKKKCCVEKPMPSQVMTGTVLGKPKGLMSVATKVAIQMVCKLGGAPWSVAIPMKDTMVCGFDVNKDSSLKGESCGAFISSLDEKFTKWTSSTIYHKHNAELNTAMYSLMVKALRQYEKVNNKIPSRIIVYRDGVGDGEIETVKTVEIENIKRAFEGQNIKFTYIIVSKRINSRFFTNGNGNGGKLGNPPSGTVVDDVVTLPERYDFFLVSQSVRQGTVNPTSYNVIEDSSGLQPKHIQMLTYKLTHLYYNWPGTVRVPAPCQYAHKLAFLVGQSLHKEPSPELEQQLFYL